MSKIPYCETEKTCVSELHRFENKFELSNFIRF